MPGPEIYNEGWCAKCGDAPRANGAYCRLCWNAYQSEYKKRLYRTNPSYRSKARARSRERLYGVSDSLFTELWAQQGGVCAVCLLDDCERELHVDHDHETGAIRGLLCSRCNTALGLLKDNPHVMQRAMEYVA